MKIYISFVCCALLCTLSFVSRAQGENNNWCFGWKMGLSFNTYPPAFLTDSMHVIESSSSVSDASGNLLFYTSGSNVWDRSHTRMPNDSGISGNGPAGPGGLAMGSSALGVVVIQSPVDDNQYYIVTTDANEDALFNAYYSVVDMSLNGGMGDVVAGQKNILFATDIREGVIAGRAGDCAGYWVIVHKRTGSDYLSFKIDGNGFSAVPVISPGLNMMDGAMCLNKEGNRLVRQAGTTETASFNNVTGVLSNFLTIDTTTLGGYPIFSSDGTKLYSFGTNIYQYTISLLPNAVAVRSSRALIDTGQWGRPRCDPQGKLYSLKNGPSGDLGRINNPDNTGLACGFVANALTMPPPVINAFSELGSDALINALPTDTVVHVLDTTICFLQELTLSADPSGLRRVWSTGSTGLQETFTEDGTYWLYSIKNCVANIDTFHIRFTNFTLSLGNNDTNLCAGDSLILDATTPGASYLWHDGSTGAIKIITQGGTYAVSVRVGICILSDTLNVRYINPSLDIQERDTTICKGDQVMLHAQGTPENTYLWNTGSTASNILSDGAGTYTVQATTVCGVLTDSITIAEELCNCNGPFIPNAFSPNGDGHNDILEVLLHCPGLTNYTFTIFNRYGQPVYKSSQPGQGWDGSFNGSHSDIGTYFLYLRYKDNTGKEIIKRGDVVLIR